MENGKLIKNIDEEYEKAQIRDKIDEIKKQSDYVEFKANMKRYEKKINEFSFSSEKS